MKGDFNNELDSFTGLGKQGEGMDDIMLWTAAIILIALWLLGIVTAHTLGGVIHILLVIAVIAILIRIIKGKRIL